MFKIAHIVLLIMITVISSGCAAKHDMMSYMKTANANNSNKINAKAYVYSDVIDLSNGWPKDENILNINEALVEQTKQSLKYEGYTIVNDKDKIAADLLVQVTRNQFGFYTTEKRDVTTNEIKSRVFTFQSVIYNIRAYLNTDVTDKKYEIIKFNREVVFTATPSSLTRDKCLKEAIEGYGQQVVTSYSKTELSKKPVTNAKVEVINNVEEFDNKILGFKKSLK